MPIHIASEYLSGVFALETFPTVLAGIVSIIALKQWSAGVDLLGRLDREADKAEREEVDFGQTTTTTTTKHTRPRDLHGTVVLVVGGFTSQGLLVCSQLSSLGAQLVLLTPTLRSSYVVQMVHLLRDGTSNPLIYAEQCDVTSLASVEAFAAQWNLGEGTGLGAGPAGGLGASTGMGGVSSLSSMPRPDAGRNDEGKGAGVTPRRVDSIVFMPLDSTRYALGSGPRRTREAVEQNYAETLGRFHLVNILLPSLLLLPPNRDIRIVSLLSPWYAAGSPTFDVHNMEHDTRNAKAVRAVKFPSTSPWTLDGKQSLLWLALSRELQRRIQLMTDADQRPRTKLPGIDEEGKVAGKATPTNVNFINVCTGFERGRDVLDYVLPRTGLGTKDLKEDLAEELDAADGDGAKGEIPQSKSGNDLKGFLDPRLRKRKTNRRSGTSATSDADTVSSKLDRQLNPESNSVPYQLVALARYAVVILLWPLAWLLCKTPRRAAESVTWATIAPVFSGKTFDPAQLGAITVVPGELHREGRVVRPPLPDDLLPGAATDVLWRTMEERAKGLLSTK